MLTCIRCYLQKRIGQNSVNFSKIASTNSINVQLDAKDFSMSKFDNQPVQCCPSQRSCLKVLICASSCMIFCKVCHGFYDAYRINNFKHYTDIINAFYFKR